MADTEYPKPSFTADVVLLRWHGGHLECLLIERKHDPYAGSWALPGGFVEPGENAETGALRELKEETGVDPVPLFALGCYAEPGRDPRGWVVSAGFLGLAPADTWAAAGDDAKTVRWARLSDLPTLAFDHGHIIADAIERLRGLVQTGTEPLRLLPEPFRGRQVRFLYNQILGTEVKPSAFKAWLRRREAIERVGPARFKRAAGLAPDWLR